MSWHVPGYIHRRELVDGGTGRLVLAIEEATGDLVVIKYLKAPEFVIERVREDMLLIATLDSAYFPRIREFAEDPDTHRAAIVMDPIDGVSLRALLRDYGAFAPEAALLVYRDALRGLMLTHELGIVHGDVRPENIMVDAGGRALLLDVGAAAWVQRDVTLSAGVYWAPERWRESFSVSADLYALTIVLVEMYLGEPPYWEASQLLALRYLHEQGDIDITVFPAALHEVIRLGLAKDVVTRGEAATLLELVETAGVIEFGVEWEAVGRGHLRSRIARARVPLSAAVEVDEVDSSTELVELDDYYADDTDAGVAVGVAAVAGAEEIEEIDVESSGAAFSALEEETAEYSVVTAAEDIVTVAEINEVRATEAFAVASEDEELTAEEEAAVVEIEITMGLVEVAESAEYAEVVEETTAGEAVSIEGVAAAGFVAEDIVIEEGVLEEGVVEEGVLVEEASADEVIAVEVAAEEVVLSEDIVVAEEVVVVEDVVAEDVLVAEEIVAAEDIAVAEEVVVAEGVVGAEESGGVTAGEVMVGAGAVAGAAFLGEEAFAAEEASGFEAVAIEEESLVAESVAEESVAAAAMVEESAVEEEVVGAGAVGADTETTMVFAAVGASEIATTEMPIVAGAGAGGGGELVGAGAASAGGGKPTNSGSFVRRHPWVTTCIGVALILVCGAVALALTSGPAGGPSPVAEQSSTKGGVPVGGQTSSQVGQTGSPTPIGQAGGPSGATATQTGALPSSGVSQIAGLPSSNSSQQGGTPSASSGNIGGSPSSSSGSGGTPSTTPSNGGGTTTPTTPTPSPTQSLPKTGIHPVREMGIVALMMIMVGALLLVVFRRRRDEIEAAPES